MNLLSSPALVTVLFALSVVCPVFAAPVTNKVTGTIIYEGTWPKGTWSGTNTAVNGVLVWDESKTNLTGTVCMDLAKWDSGNAVRDRHTRTMFDTGKFTNACYTITAVKGRPGTGNVTLVTTLDLHGTQRAQSVPGTLKVEKDRLTFRGEAVLRLSEWGLKRPSLLGAEVADEVRLLIQCNTTTP